MIDQSNKDKEKAVDVIFTGTHCLKCPPSVSLIKGEAQWFKMRVWGKNLAENKYGEPLEYVYDVPLCKNCADIVRKKNNDAAIEKSETLKNHD